MATDLPNRIELVLKSIIIILLTGLTLMKRGRVDIAKFFKSWGLKIIIQHREKKSKLKGLAGNQKTITKKVRRHGNCLRLKTLRQNKKIDKFQQKDYDINLDTKIVNSHSNKRGNKTREGS